MSFFKEKIEEKVEERVEESMIEQAIESLGLGDDMSKKISHVVEEEMSGKPVNLTDAIAEIEAPPKETLKDKIEGVFHHKPAPAAEPADPMVNILAAISGAAQPEPPAHKPSFKEKFEENVLGKHHEEPPPPPPQLSLKEKFEEDVLGIHRPVPPAPQATHKPTLDEKFAETVFGIHPPEPPQPKQQETLAGMIEDSLFGKH
ncbi:hypothetical protein HDU84_005166, partial [Entophlyctis sp. JEL0112]